jgi:hypothetical protein
MNYSSRGLHSFLIASIFLFSIIKPLSALPTFEPFRMRIFRKAYPDVSFITKYDTEKKDWLITISVDDRTAELYWSNGKMLPADKLDEKDKYWSLLYEYAEKVPDPEEFTDSDIEQIREFSSTENRQNGAGTPPFFYDVVYDCETQASTEKHITRFTFLGKRVNLHERLKKPLEEVEKEINKEAETDPEIAAFVKKISQEYGYSWRKIRDSSSRSFHSIGLALDILPTGWNQKNIYWAWRRDIDPDNWMLTPLSRRWMPPEKVIKIFENNGFIWGGKWAIWDDMHFEYHPELILNQQLKHIFTQD